MSLGNHSRVSIPARKPSCPTLAPLYSTETYDVDRMLLEIAIMNSILYGIDGQEARNYSAPCSQMRVGGVDYTHRRPCAGPACSSTLAHGAATRSIPCADPKTLDTFKVPSWGPTDSPNGTAAHAYVERVHAAHGLGVLQFTAWAASTCRERGMRTPSCGAPGHSHSRCLGAPFGEVMDYVVTHSR
jgi:hypothetical protein